MSVVLLKDGARAKVTFRGVESSTKMDIPTLSNGQWTVHEDKFTLVSEGQTWNFTRKKAE
jgi:hypothetical protein